MTEYWTDLGEHISKVFPNSPHQIGWDSSSLKAFIRCPRYYKYSIIDGWKGKAVSPHLAFGTLYHSALNRFEHLRAHGESYDSAMMQTIKRALIDSINFTSEHASKNRESLIRTLVWYFEENRNSPLQTILLTNEQAATELSFRYELDLKSELTGETYMFCGHFDRLARLQDSPAFIVDSKTTVSYLTPKYFQQYELDPQFFFYTFSSNVVIDESVKGVIIEGTQVGATFARFDRGFILFSKNRLNEWYNDVVHYLRAAEKCAENNYYPMNLNSCNDYGGCAFKGVCSADPIMREMLLKQNYKKEPWQPLVERGEE